MNRWTRPVNGALLALFVITTVSGAISFGVGSPPVSAILVAVHGIAGTALLLLAPAKVRIARRGLRRPGWSRRVIGLALAASALVAIVSGVLHAVGGFRTWAGLLPMQLHVGAALLAAGLLAAHVWRHRRRSALRSADLDRRLALRAVGVVVGAAALWAVAPGLQRRATGSHEVGSGDPAAMPVTQWLLDPVPRIAPASWWLRAGERELDLAALAALPQRAERAVLDCTGGWWAEQEWRGVPLSALLPSDPPPGSSIEVVSATGYRRRLPAADAGSLLLATHAAGRPLSPGHGGPARLVAPGRRGFWWVKWVVAVEVVDEPWWWQPPFPLQ